MIFENEYVIINNQFVNKDIRKCIAIDAKYVPCSPVFTRNGNYFKNMKENL